MQSRRPSMECRRIIRKLENDHNLLPFITLKFLSEKQEESSNLNEFQNKYGFTFRDYELLSSMEKKYENEDNSYLSDIRSAINALKNSTNKYISEIYMDMPEETLKENVLNQIILLLHFNVSAPDLYKIYNTNLRFIHDEYRVPRRLSYLMAELIKTEGQIDKIYDPACRNAHMITQLDFNEAILYEKNTQLYLEAIQNMIIHDIDFEKVKIANEEIIMDDTDDKYDRIVSVPYILSKRRRDLNEKISTIPKYNEFIKGNLDSVQLLNLIGHLSDEGIIITVIPPNLLASKQAQELRKCIIENKLLDAVIEYGRTRSAINLSIIVLKKNRQNDEILFTRFSEHYMALGSTYKKLIDCYRNREIIPKFSNLVTKDEIIENDYNLNPKRYVYTLDYEKKEIAEVITKQDEYTSQIRKLDEEIDSLLNEINK